MSSCSEIALILSLYFCCFLITLKFCLYGSGLSWIEHDGFHFNGFRFFFVFFFCMSDYLECFACVD